MATLILDDGTRYRGQIFGDKRSISGEVGWFIFSTKLSISLIFVYINN